MSDDIWDPFLRLSLRVKQEAARHGLKVVKHFFTAEEDGSRQMTLYVRYDPEAIVPPNAGEVIEEAFQQLIQEEMSLKKKTEVKKASKELTDLLNNLQKESD